MHWKSCPKREQWLLSLWHTNVPSSSMWREVPRAMKAAGNSDRFPQSQHKLVTLVQMTGGGEQVLSLPLSLTTFSCYYTSKSWKEPISQLHKPPPAVRYASENPSEARVKSQRPTCSFPYHCQLVRHLHTRAIFGVLTACLVQFIPRSVHDHYFIPSLASLTL